MKIEEVLPHLREGGEVEINGIKTTFSQLKERNLGRLTSREDFRIVEKPYNKSFYTRGSFSATELIKALSQYKVFDSRKIYKVTIEEVKE